VAPYPYLVRARTSCLGISSPVQINQPTFVVSSFDEQFCVGLTQPVAGRQVARHDQLMVTVRFNATGAGYVESPMAQGCPYITLVYSGATPLFGSKEDLSLADGGSSASGTRIMVTLGNGQKWAIYASQPIQLTLAVGADPFNTSGPVRKSTLTASAPFYGGRLLML
jgi:endoglucanase Acf2